MLYKQYAEAGIENNRLFSVLLCISHIIEKDLHWEQFIGNLERLILKYSDIDISTMGFPTNWKEYFATGKEADVSMSVSDATSKEQE